MCANPVIYFLNAEQKSSGVAIAMAMPSGYKCMHSGRMMHMEMNGRE